MESKSPYFSPRKTRNFVKQTGLKAILQKSSEPAPSTSGTRKKPAATVSVSVPQIKIEKSEPAVVETGRVKIKLEASPDGHAAATVGQKTPEKQVAKPARRKRTPIKIEETENAAGKEPKWEPVNWRAMLDNIRRMRQERPAPVDTMGCDQFRDDATLPAKSRRFHTLVSLMLSSQTKDQVNFECMQRLRRHGLTPENVVATDAATLEQLIYPVSFYKNKAKFLRQASQKLLADHSGDIPDTLEGLMALPGVGAKMAHLCMRSAWNIVTGIGVDTHVHRISNWLLWVPKETRTPEETRVALERWLPFELWEEVNQLLVGFGQTVCTSTRPRCDECANAGICPAKGKHGIRKTPVKKEVKQEDLEF